MRIGVRPSRRGVDRITINLASMIDVSFLLLFYFMVATMLEDRETRLSAALEAQGQGGASAAGDFQPQIIEVKLVNSAPAYQLGARVVRSRDELAAAVDALPRQAGVFIKVFDDVPVGFAVTAIQIARDAGFQQVTYVPAR